MKKLLLPLLIVCLSFTVLADFSGITPHSNSTADRILKQAIAECNISQVKEFLDLGMTVSPDLIENALQSVNRTYWYHTACKGFCVAGGITAALGVVWSGLASWKAYKDLAIVRDKLFPWYKNVIRRRPEPKKEQAYYLAIKHLEDCGLPKDVIKRIYGYSAKSYEFVTLHNVNKREPSWKKGYIGPINKQAFMLKRNPLENNNQQRNSVRLDNFKQWFSKLNNLNYFSDKYYERVVTRCYSDSDQLYGHNIQQIPDKTEVSFSDPYYPPNLPEHAADMNMLAEHERVATESLGAQYSLRGGKNLSDYFNVLEYVTHPQDKDKINTWPLLGKMLTIPGLAALGSAALACASYYCYKAVGVRHDTACQVAQLLLSHSYRSISPEIQTKYKRTFEYLNRHNTKITH